MRHQSHNPQSATSFRRPTGLRLGRCVLPALLFLMIFGATALRAQTSTNAGSFNLNIGLNGLNQPVEVDGAIKVLAIMTLLTLAPSIILLMTCFTRIVIVLSFVRSALSLQGTPANQIIIGLSLFLTFFIMAPVWERIDQEALQPYRAKEITSEVALERATVPLRAFMLKQTRPKDVELFVAMAKLGPTPADKLPLKVVIPGFIISELRTAFQMGFLLFVPVHSHRPHRRHRADEHGHDDDAAHDHFPAAENSAVRPGGRLASHRQFPRPKLWSLII